MASLDPLASQPLVKGERAKPRTPDDGLMRQISETHAPDGRQIDVKPILQIVEDIFIFATPTPATSHGKIREAEEGKSQVDDDAVIDLLAYIIARLSSEISYKSMGGSADAHSTTVSLFNMVSSYTWEAKLVLTLAAFALNYGEFWLVTQIYSTNKLANKMKILKLLPDMTEDLMRARFDAMDNLIKSILDLTKCIVEFSELPPAYISPDSPALSSAISTIPSSVYWTFRSVVCCANHIASLTGMGHELIASAAEAWELSSLAHKINTIYDFLKEKLNICHQQIEKKKQLEAYDVLQRAFEVAHLDNMKILKLLIYPKDDILPLFDGSNKRRVGLEVLRRKTVLLLISGLDISHDELIILEQIYQESRLNSMRPESQYEIVWIPCMDRSDPWTDTSQGQFENLQAMMPWYVVCHPSLIDHAAHRFIKENWQFNRKAILVVLDPQGKVMSSNALHMLWIWGSIAFPFTRNREEALWKEENWRLEFLVDGIDPLILDWIREEKHIILYGGDDIEWIRRFTATARSVARSAQIPLEMIYVGKSSKLEQVRRITAIITRENLSNVWPETVYVWFFWTRLESMLFSRIQLGSFDEGDSLLQEVKKLLSYDKSGVWAICSRGSSVALNGFGDTILTALLEFDKWKEVANTNGFEVAFKEHYENLLKNADHPCCRLEFPTTVGRIPENMNCPECYRSMEKFMTFSCCHDAPNSGL